MHEDDALRYSGPVVIELESHLELTVVALDPELGRRPATAHAADSYLARTVPRSRLPARDEGEHGDGCCPE